MWYILRIADRCVRCRNNDIVVKNRTSGEEKAFVLGETEAVGHSRDMLSNFSSQNLANVSVS